MTGTPQAASEALASFVPAPLLRQLARDGAPRLQAEALHAAVLFADLKGFTALAERLAKRGEQGAEALSDIINRSFGRLLERVHAHGGEVLHYPGDAVLALWPAAHAQALELPVRHAVACGLSLQALFVDPEQADGLRLRVAVSAGAVRALTLGGEQDRWHWLLEGTPVQRAGLLQAAAPTQGVAVDSTLREHFDDAELQTLTDDAYLLKHWPAAPTSRAAPAPPSAAAGVAAFVGKGVRHRLEAGQLDWLAELRPVCVLFASLAQPSRHSLDSLQAICRALQQAVYGQGGSVNQLVQDDKGLVLVAGWGLPNASYEHNAERALGAALAMHAALAALGQPLAVGVASGEAFCGIRGGARRREYAMIGATVIRAARLMQAAGDGVLCDLASCEAARGFSGEPAAASLPAWRPRRAAGLPATARPALAMVGRQRELGALQAAVQALLERRPAPLILLEADAGLGKTRLLEALADHATSRPLRLLQGRADPVQQGTPYHAWRAPLRALLRVDAGTPPSQLRERIARAFADLPELGARSDWLAPVLGLELASGEGDIETSGGARAEGVRALVLHLLAATSRQQPVLLLIEDAHWLDGASWSLLRALAGQSAAGHGLAILPILSSRPLETPLASEAAALLALPGVQRQSLGPLTPAETQALVARRLDVVRLSAPLAELIAHRAEGHPFYSEELALALRELGALSVSGDEADLAIDPAQLGRIGLPSTLQGVIHSRIDQLPAAEALTLKVGSVIGRRFAMLWLVSLLPVAAGNAQLLDQLQHLCDRELLLQEAQADLHYRYKHALIQDVAYHLLPFAQRRELHRRLAGLLEFGAPFPPAQLYPLLAHHWQRAEQVDKSLEYLELAGREAARAGAHREAANAFRQALKLAERGTHAIPALVLARWRRQLADAQFGLGDLAACEQASRDTLAALDRPAPTSPRGWFGLLLRESLRFWLRPPRAEHGEAQDCAVEAALAMQRIAERHFYTRDALPMLAGAIAAANHASRSGARAPVARSYGMLGMALGLSGLHRAGERYLQRARDDAAARGDLAGGVYASYATAGLLLSLARWQDLEPIAAEGLRLARELGDPQELEVALTVAGHLAFYTGDIAGSLQHFVDVQHSAFGRSDQHIAWGLYAQGRALVFSGEFERALDLLERADGLLQGSGDDMSAIICSGLQALAWLRLGELARAGAVADRAAELIARNAPTVFAYVEPFFAVAAVRLAQWQAALTGGDNGKREAAQARAALKPLRQLAFMFPIARARCTALQGHAALLADQPRRALRKLRAARELALRHRMPWDQAHAEFLLGRCPALGDTERRHCAAQAEAGYARIGARPYHHALTRS